MNVPFIDLKAQYHAVQDEIDNGMRAVLERGDYILGKEEKEFEEAFARYCGTTYAVGVNSGTDALHIALGALGIGEGDEVIVPTFTFIATALSISYAGARPVFVDSEEETNNMDPKSLKTAITQRTKAILPVHLYGQTANMNEIIQIAREHKIAVVEDACQAHGACYQGKRAGSLGDVGCFSFYPTKSLGACGDGGMLITNNEKIYKLAGMLRDYGRVNRYEHTIKGYNSRLDTLQAVILLAKLKHLDEWNALRNKNAQYYSELLKGVDGVRVPTIKDDRTHVFQTYAVRVKERDRIGDELKKNGVSVLIHYPIPLHLQEAYKELGYSKGDFPVAETITAEVLSLPMSPHMTQEQIEYVCATLKKVL